MTPPRISGNTQIDLSAINRSQVARDTNIDLAHISRIFAGKAKPSLPVAIEIAKSVSKQLGKEITLEQLCEALGINGSLS